MYKPKFKVGDVLRCKNRNVRNDSFQAHFYARINKVYTNQEGEWCYDITSYRFKTHEVINKNYDWECKDWEKAVKWKVPKKFKDAFELKLLVEEL